MANPHHTSMTFCCGGERRVVVRMCTSHCCLSNSKHPGLKTFRVGQMQLQERSRVLRFASGKAADPGSTHVPLRASRLLGLLLCLASLSHFFLSHRLSLFRRGDGEGAVVYASALLPRPHDAFPRTGEDLFRLIDQCFGDERGHLYPGDSALCRDVLFAPSSYFSSAANRPASPTSSRSDGAHPRLFEFLPLHRV